MMTNGSKKFYNEYVNAKIKPYTVHSICQMTKHACKHSLHIPDFMESDSFLLNPESHVWDDMNEEPAAVPIDVFIVDKMKHVFRDPEPLSPGKSILSKKSSGVRSIRKSRSSVRGGSVSNSDVDSPGLRPGR